MTKEQKMKLLEQSDYIVFYGELYNVRFVIYNDMASITSVRTSETNQISMDELLEDENLKILQLAVKEEATLTHTETFYLKESK